MPGKYLLKDLYKEIDLFDRKIAHCQNFEKFELESDRLAAIGKLNTKRSQLVKKAEVLSKSGLSCEEKDLPRSFRDDRVRTGTA